MDVSLLGVSPMGTPHGHVPKLACPPSHGCVPQWACPPRGRAPRVGGACPGRGSLAAALAEVADEGDDDGEGHHGSHRPHLGPHQPTWGHSRVRTPLGGQSPPPGGKKPPPRGQIPPQGGN